MTTLSLDLLGMPFLLALHRRHERGFAGRRSVLCNTLRMFIAWAQADFPKAENAGVVVDRFMQSTDTDQVVEVRGSREGKDKVRARHPLPNAS